MGRGEDFYGSKLESLYQSMGYDYGGSGGSYRHVSKHVPVASMAARVEAIADASITKKSDTLYMVQGTGAEPYAVDLAAQTCSCPAFANRPGYPCKHLARVTALASGLAVADAARMATEADERRREIDLVIDPLAAVTHHSRGNYYLGEGQRLAPGLVALGGKVRLPEGVETIPICNRSGQPGQAKLARILDLRAIDLDVHHQGVGPVAIEGIRNAIESGAGYDEARQWRRIVRKYGEKAVATHIGLRPEVDLTMLAKAGEAGVLLEDPALAAQADEDIAVYAAWLESEAAAIAANSVKRAA